MPVTKRGASWQATVNHKGQRLRKDFPTKPEAELWHAQTKADLLAGRLPSGETPKEAVKVNTLEDLIQHTFKARWRGTKAETERMQAARFCVNVLGADRDVATLNPSDPVEIKETLRDMERSDATINRKLSALSTMMKEALDLGWLKSKFSVGLLKERATRVRFIDEAEEVKMLAWCDRMGEPVFKAYLMLSLDTGFRRGEVLKIIKQDVGNENLWTYDTKSGRNREVPLTTRAKASLAWLAQPINDPKAKVVKLEKHHIRDKWDKMKYSMGLTNDDQFIPHVMRHTFVTRLLHRGVDIKTVQELAGHLRIETTQRYAQTSPARKVQAIAVLDVPHATRVADAA